MNSIKATFLPSRPLRSPLSGPEFARSERSGSSEDWGRPWSRGENEATLLIYCLCLPIVKLIFQRSGYHIREPKPVIMKHLFIIQLLSYVLLAHAAQTTLLEACSGLKNLSSCKFKFSVPTGFTVKTKEVSEKKVCHHRSNRSIFTDHDTIVS